MHSTKTAFQTLAGNLRLSWTTASKYGIGTGCTRRALLEVRDEGRVDRIGHRRTHVIAEFQDSRVRVPARARADEHEAEQASRMVYGEALRDRGPHRMADDEGLAHARCGHDAATSDARVLWPIALSPVGPRRRVPEASARRPGRNRQLTAGTGS
jgi:hypothetical protein